MTEYIMREPVILAVNMAADKFPYAKDREIPETYSKYNEGWTDACDYIMSMIEAENCADVVPVLHGQWEVNGINPADNTIGNYHCSVCNGVSLKSSNYCPNCGAKMSEDC